MKIFGIGDLHLSRDGNKPMDIFGKNWDNHSEILIQNWTEKVSKQDVILIPGDISWGMRLREAEADLKLLQQLPGQKVCIRGNHDYWWEKVGKLNASFRGICFLQNKAFVIGSLAICGSRGWVCPNSISFSEEDEKIFKRELIRLQLSLEDALKKSAKEIIVMLHYPPVYRLERSSSITALIQHYPVSQVIYGHLHDENSWQEAIQGTYEGIDYKLVSADYLSFVPAVIKE